MKTEWQYAAELGLHDNPQKCPHCGEGLVFGTLSDLSKAYTHTDWYCGGCGGYVSELVYGKQRIQGGEGI